ncbi:hypothetical protein BDV59DRAFT_181783 [Aspergillus ambiguus]|uniref:uncharacterized protein n=1 Tax=Aspergillus ambiguus TaxID=176160 RepID=UPI003CCE211A
MEFSGPYPGHERRNNRWTLKIIGALPFPERMWYPRQAPWIGKGFSLARSCQGWLLARRSLVRWTLRGALARSCTRPRRTLARLRHPLGLSRKDA